MILNPVVSTEIKEVVNAMHCQAAISMIIPYEQRMGFKKELACALNVAAEK